MTQIALQFKAHATMDVGLVHLRDKVFVLANFRHTTANRHLGSREIQHCLLHTPHQVLEKSALGKVGSPIETMQAVKRLKDLPRNDVNTGSICPAAA